MTICDLHNDYLTELKTNAQIENYLKSQKNLHTLLSPIWTTKLKDVKEFAYNKSLFIQSLKLDYKTQICFEDMKFFDDDYDFLKSIKPLYCGLVWNNDNKFGGGAYGKGTLTQKGKNLVKNLEKQNIFVDTAHMNIQTFNAFLSQTEKPIFCSHSGFCDIVFDKRNFSKQQLKDIVSSNGLIGLYFVGKYIEKDKATCDSIVKNIDYFVQNFGLENLAIGTDFFGTSDLPCDVQSYYDFSKIKQKLHQIGYKNAQIDAIFYKNYEIFVNRSQFWKIWLLQNCLHK